MAGFEDDIAKEIADIIRQHVAARRSRSRSGLQNLNAA